MQHLQLGRVAALMAVLATSACQPPLRVERYTAGDTIKIRTHVTAGIDTARLEIVARYSVSRPHGDTSRSRITALALNDAGHVFIATEQGALQQLNSGTFQLWQPGPEPAAADILRQLRPGTVSDTLAPDPAGERSCGRGPNRHFRSGRFADIRLRYLPSLQRAELPSGATVIGCNADYSFDIIERSGQITRVTHERAAVPVSQDERSSFKKAWILRMRNAEPGPNWDWQGDSLPDWKPAYQRILGSSDSRIWIWPSQPSQSVAAPPQWVLVGGPRKLWVEPNNGAFDVFAQDGSFLGPVAISGELGFAPYGVTPAPVMRADTMWLVVADSAGSHALVRAHVHWPRRPHVRGRTRQATHATRSDSSWRAQIQ